MLNVKCYWVQSFTSLQSNFAMVCTLPRIFLLFKPSLVPGWWGLPHGTIKRVPESFRENYLKVSSVYFSTLYEFSQFNDTTSILHCHTIRMCFLWFSSSCLAMWSWTLALNTTAASWHGITRSLCRGHRAQVTNSMPGPNNTLKDAEWYDGSHIDLTLTD